LNSISTTFRRERRREVTIEPTERHPLGLARTRWAYLAAVVIPWIVGAALIPVRDELDQSSALILVVPVALIALAGGLGPGLLASVSATVSFDVLLTRPYFGFAIHDNDDVVAAVTLLVVGALIGTVASRLARVDTRAVVRRRTLDGLTAFIQLIADDEVDGRGDDDALRAAAADTISQILGLSACEWEPRVGPSSAPTILPNGQLMGYSTDLGEDRAQLPDPTELPVGARDRDHGRFILRPTRGHNVSIEERRTAAAVAELLAHEMTRRSLPRVGPDAR
jgi:hypothetical protein